MANYLGQRGRFDEVTKHHQATLASTGAPLHASGKTLDKDSQIRQARETIGSVKISNGQVFTGLLPDADNVTAHAVVDHKRSVRIVDIPDPDHPQSHTIRIMNLETPDGVQHAAILQIDNKTHEVEKVYVNIDKDGKADQIGKGLANSQSDLLNPKYGGLHFTHYTIEPLNDEHKGMVKDVNHAIDKIYQSRRDHPVVGADGKREASRPEPIDPRDGKIATTQMEHRDSSVAHAPADLNHKQGTAATTHADNHTKSADLARHNKNFRPH